MDSRKLEEHALLMNITDNVNNNNVCLSILEINNTNGDISTDVVTINSNYSVSQSRRKQYSSKVAVSLKDFFQYRSQEDTKPTVVDKLISKNKYALLESQMRKVRQKSNSSRKETSSNKTVNKNVREKSNNRCTLRSARKDTFNANICSLKHKHCNKKSPLRKRGRPAGSKLLDANNKAEQQTKKSVTKTRQKKIKKRNDVLKSVSPHTDRKRKGRNATSSNAKKLKPAYSHKVVKYQTRSGCKNMKNWKLKMLSNERTRSPKCNKRKTKTSLNAVKIALEQAVINKINNVTTKSNIRNDVLNNNTITGENKNLKTSESSPKTVSSAETEKISSSVGVETVKRKRGRKPKFDKPSSELSNFIMNGFLEKPFTNKSDDSERDAPPRNCSQSIQKCIKRRKMDDSENSSILCNDLKSSKIVNETCLENDDSFSEFETSNLTVNQYEISDLIGESDDKIGSLSQSEDISDLASDKVDESDFRETLDVSHFSDYEYTINDVKNKNVPVENRNFIHRANSDSEYKSSGEEESDIQYITDDQPTIEYIDLDNTDEDIIIEDSISSQDVSVVINEERFLENSYKECNVMDETNSTNGAKSDSFSKETYKNIIDLCYNQPDISDQISPTEHNNSSTDENTNELENSAIKESILNALGLQALEKVNRNKSVDNYTGTLKAVIKLHKTSDTDKGYRRMEMKQSTSKHLGDSIQMDSNSEENKNYEANHANCDNSSRDSINSNSSQCSVSTINSNASNVDTRFNDFDTTAVGYLGEYLSKINSPSTKDKTKSAASLVVPEKSSSFSIHPNRLCSDVCKYCFGKFGSLDTPCHVAQLKAPERQKNILTCEPNLKMDTCLCDACYRYVDRKANKPPTKRKGIRRASALQHTPCAVEGCTQIVRNFVKRKWLLRLRRKIEKLSFNLTKPGQGIYNGLCSQHYYLVNFYTACGICKKRLNRNQLYSVNSELDNLNIALMQDHIPIQLTDNVLICKLCHYHISIRLKYGKSSQMPIDQKGHYQHFHKKLLRKYNIEMEDEQNSEKKTNETSENQRATTNFPVYNVLDDTITISDDEPTELPEETTIPSMTTNVPDVPPCSEKSEPRKNYPVGFTNIANLLNPLDGERNGDKQRRDNNATRIQVKFGNLNIGKLSNLNIGQDSRAETNHHIEQSYPRHGELPLMANFNFENPSLQNKNWEKCISTIQFDKNTKKLWQDLQKPYGNQSSFMRHLIMLEKYWRSGFLALSENASSGAVKYINGVKNRVDSLESSTSSNFKSFDATLKNNSLPSTKLSSNISNEKSIPTQNVPNEKSVPLMCIPNEKSVPPSAPQDQNVPRQIKVVTNNTSLIPAGPSCSNVQSTPPSPPLGQVSAVTSSPYAILKAPSSVYTIKSSEFKNISNFKPLIAGRNPNFGKRVYLNTSQVKSVIPVTLQQFREMNYKPSQPSSQIISLPFIKKPSISVTVTHTVVTPSTGNVSTIPKLSAALDKPSSKSTSPLLMAKFPKTLTVTQIDDSDSSKLDGHKSIPSAFLAGEKPSISVFREIVD